MSNTNQQLAACNADCSYSYHPYKTMNIHSRLIDFSTNKPIASVNVFLEKDSTIGTITNADGFFQINALPDDRIVFSHVAFQNEVFKANEIEPTEYLLPATNMLDEVVVVAKKKKNWIIAALALLSVIAIASKSKDEAEETVKTKA